MPGLLAGFLVLGMYLIAMRLTNVWLLVAIMIAISFTIDFGLGASWACYQDIGGRHVATVLGVGNMCGNFGAAYFGWYIGVLAKADNWNAVFLIAGLAMAVYASGWLLFDATLSRDCPLLMAIFLLLSISVVVANLVTDLAYMRLDPRVRYA